MAKKKQSKQHLSAAQKVGIGVGLTTAAVAAAGAYFLYGSPSAAKNRKKVRSWMLKAKADVLEALENAQHMTKEEYEALVESIGAVYGRLKHVSASEVKEFTKEMKDHWTKIQKAGKGGTKKPVKKAAKKPAKRSSKRGSRKSSK